MTQSQELRERCLEYDEDACDGPVAWRESLSGTGTMIPRCDRHWGKRLVEQERINRDYPDSPIPPAWFDPADAGERWDDEY